MAERVFLATRDLVFRSKLAAVVRAAGAAVTADETGCDVAVTDVAGAGAAERIRTWAGMGIRVLAYGSHVRADLLRAARNAGAVAVPNSDVAETLRGMLSAADPGPTARG